MLGHASLFVGLVVLLAAATNLMDSTQALQCYSCENCAVPYVASDADIVDCSSLPKEPGFETADSNYNCVRGKYASGVSFRTCTGQPEYFKNANSDSKLIVMCSTNDLCNENSEKEKKSSADEKKKEQKNAEEEKKKKVDEETAEKKKNWKNGNVLKQKKLSNMTILAPKDQVEDILNSASSSSFHSSSFHVFKSFFPVVLFSSFILLR